ncbi:MAG: PrsW family glutamic-type intramembrane protease [Proteobacteria bacterium]|nr:PrsW family glutamic-type intramembrane protease [Pseudomonadota bacterium]
MSRIRTVVATEIVLLFGLLGYVGVAYAVERGAGLTTALDLSPPGALVISAVPALLWLAYFYVQDRYEPEPVHYVVGVYLLGCLVAGPLSGVLIELLLTPRPLTIQTVHPLSFERIVRALLIVALAQELCKYVVVRYTVYLSPEFDEPMDGLVYMTAAGIGVATWKNYHYLDGLAGNVFLTFGAAKAVITTLADACFAGVMGYAMGRAKFSSLSSGYRSAILFAGLLLATGLNGLFQTVENAITAAGMDMEPWRALAYTALFAAAVFFATSLLMRGLLMRSPFRPSIGSAEIGSEE